MKTFYVLIVSVLMLLLASCERTVSFELDDVSPKLVVEATIENGKHPVVYLSRSVGYFSKIDPVILANSFVHDAEVYVSDGVSTYKLKEYSDTIGSIVLYYYTIDFADPAAFSFIGQLNQAYSLRVILAGEEYTAATRIPLITKRIDSLFWKQAPGNNPPEKVTVMIQATDPPGLGDYVRYFTSHNGGIYYPGLNSVYDDQVIDNSTYEIQVEKGIDRNLPLPDGYAFFDKGDTVTLKLCNIDKATYDFWRTMEFTYISVGNPFASPTKVLSNISNGGLGYFGGYAAQYKTIIIPR